MTAQAPQTYFFNGPEAPGVRDRAISFLNRLDLTQRWKVTVELHKESRSQKQLNALWGVAYPVIAKHFGYSTKPEMEIQHWYFCGDFFGWVTGPMGTKVPRRTTSTDENGKKNPCNAEEMAAMYAEVQRTAANYGCDVPDPDPTWFMQARFDRD